MKTLEINSSGLAILTALSVLILLSGGFYSSFAMGGGQNTIQQTSGPDAKVLPFLELTSPNPISGGQFGSSVSASGSLVVIGAPYEPVKGLSSAGAAYVFNSTTGKLLRTLHSPNAQIRGSFGSVVAIDGTNVLVGAPGENAGGFSYAGHAYLFNALTGKRIGPALTSPLAKQKGWFGSQVAISGGNMLVSSSNETGQIGGLGRVYLFNTAGKLELNFSSPDPGGLGTCYGVSLSISGSIFAVGQYDGCYYLLGQVNIDGEVLIYNTSGKLTAHAYDQYPPNSDEPQYFADSISISGKTLLVGSAGKLVNGQLFTGAAYLYGISGTYIRNFTSPKPQGSGYFGNSVAQSGKLMVVGAYFEGNGKIPKTGNAYVFYTAGSLRSTLGDPNAIYNGYFGASVAMNGKVVVVGAPQESGGGLAGAGITYVYVL